VRFENLDDALEGLLRDLSRFKVDYTFEAAKKAEEIFKSRLFTVGGAEDVTGSKLPSYSAGYAKKKKKRASTWDLQDSGDLMRSIRSVAKGKNKRAVLMIVGDQLDKMESLEKRSGKTIFEISEKERKEITDYITKEILRDIKKIIEKKFK